MQEGDVSNHRGSESSPGMQDAESLRHADSFQSALSELQRSPSWRDGNSSAKQGKPYNPSKPYSLSLSQDV